MKGALFVMLVALEFWVSVIAATVLAPSREHCPPLGPWVWVCESDAQIVKPRDIAWRDGRGWHISERDRHGRIVTVCGVVHRARLGSGSALGCIGQVK